MKNIDSQIINNNGSKVAVVFDNHHLFAESFSKLLDSFYIFGDVNAFTEEVDLMRYLIALPPKKNVYLFLDYFLEGKTVLPIINDIRRIYKSAQIIIVTTSANPATIHGLLSSKINGVLSKYSDTDEVLACIKQVEAGKRYIASFMQQIIDENPAKSAMPFTDRELEIVQFAARGFTVDGTAGKLNLSRHTVAAHRRKIMAKVDCHTISELLALARKNEWIA